MPSTLTMQCAEKFGGGGVGRKGTVRYSGHNNWFANDDGRDYVGLGGGVWKSERLMQN